MATSTDRAIHALLANAESLASFANGLLDDSDASNIRLFADDDANPAYVSCETVSDIVDTLNELVNAYARHLGLEEH